MEVTQSFLAAWRALLTYTDFARGLRAGGSDGGGRDRRAAAANR